MNLILPKAKNVVVTVAVLSSTLWPVAMKTTQKQKRRKTLRLFLASNFDFLLFGRLSLFLFYQALTLCNAVDSLYVVHLNKSTNNLLVFR